MSKREETSVLKSLAIALGDGLAFGVGMKIAQVSHKPGAKLLGPARRKEPAEEPAPAFASPDQQVLERISSAVEARLAEQMSHVERRFAESEARFAVELRGVESRNFAQVARTQAGVEAVQDRLAAIENGKPDWAPLEARIRAECSRQVDEKIQSLEQRLRGEISLTGTHTAEMLIEMIEKKVLARLGEVERTVVAQSGIIRAMHEKSGDAERRFQELVSGLARVCEDAIGKQAEDPPQPADPARAAGSGETSPEPLACNFASLKEDPRAERNWRVPLVSFFIAAAGVAAWFSIRL